MGGREVVDMREDSRSHGVQISTVRRAASDAIHADAAFASTLAYTESDALLRSVLQGHAQVVLTFR